jgi:hypothetical protein
MDLPEIELLQGTKDPVDAKNNIRTAAAIGIGLSFLIQQWILNTLGKQFAFIGVCFFLQTLLILPVFLKSYYLNHSMIILASRENPHCI